MTNLYDFSVINNTGETIPLLNYQNKVLLIVNTASACGFTPQYAGIEDLYKKYKDQGFEVLAFPCNQFGNQEKSMNIPNKEGAAWHLKPNGVRLIDNNEAGHIAGIVSESLLCKDESDVEKPTFVYLYVGSESDASLLGDMHYNEQGTYIGDGIEPLASTEVLSVVQSDGSYEIGFVATGEHTLVLTCSDDTPNEADEMIFTNLQLLTVEKGNNELSFTE